MARSNPEYPADPTLLTREGLLPTAEATTGDMPSDLEQYAHLSTTLEYFESAQANLRFTQMLAYDPWRTGMERRYGKFGLAKIIESKYGMAADAEAGARSEFMSAYGLSARLEAASDDAAQKIRAVAEATYDRFRNDYNGGSPERRERRQKLLAQYRSALAGRMAITEQPASVSSESPKKYEPFAKINMRQALESGYSVTLTQEHASLSVVEQQQADPKALADIVCNVGQSRNNALAYAKDPERPFAKTYVSFSPAGWNMMLRSSADSRANIAVNKSRNKQRGFREDGVPYDDDAPRRAGIHLLENESANMRAYQENIVDPALQTVATFREACQHHGNLLRFGNRLNYTMRFNQLWQSALGEMLWAVEVVDAPRGETRMQDTARNRQLAIEKVIFGADKPEQALQSMRRLLVAMERWYTMQTEYIDYKQMEIDQYLDQHQTPEEHAAREQKQLQPAS